MSSITKVAKEARDWMMKSFPVFYREYLACLCDKEIARKTAILAERMSELPEGQCEEFMSHYLITEFRVDDLGSLILDLDSSLGIEPEARAELNKRLRSLSPEQKKRFFKKAAYGIKQETVREFIILERKDHLVMIFHLPSMLFTVVHKTFNEAVALLKEQPEQDSNLINMIYGVEEQRDETHT
jgi:hypothetical protein